MIYRFLIPTLVLAVTCFVGCNDSPTANSDPAAEASTSSAPSTKNVAKVAVMVDGTILINSESVSVDSLATKLDSLGEITEVWYHRESPEAAEPHENAMKAIAEIANRKLPIAMYLDSEFTQRASFGE